MEDCVVGERTPSKADVADRKDESAMDFQKFLFELFEKNGIVNDLRAYLRSHIIDLVKKTQAGELIMCQKHFTQRLELSLQAMNIIIAEYLLRMDFNYSLSVFVAEIPLANMVFDFSSNLMHNSKGDIKTIKFNDVDVWKILNYLGIKCDSDYASNVTDMYRKDEVPLIMCMLRCSSMYRRELYMEQDVRSEGSSCSVKSLDRLGKEGETRTAAKGAQPPDKCQHCSVCKICQSRMSQMKEKYNKKKNHIYENIESTDSLQSNVDMLMRNIGDTEKTLIDEMFQQLKSVYEKEVEMLRQGEERQVKRSLASHALQLQKQKEEMEAMFKEREAALERNVREKKKFLWELARSLREQHAQMSRAMHAVRLDTERLAAKEHSLKAQLSEAEEALRSRGEDMRAQISKELLALEEHLEEMKRERDTITRERSELEQLKVERDNSSMKTPQQPSEDLLLKDELAVLRRFIDTSKVSKCVVERSTLTEVTGDVTGKSYTVLNNEQTGQEDRWGLKSDSEERVQPPHKLVNDLKKEKNVNFTATRSHVDEFYAECGRVRSRSSASSDPSDRDLVDRLRDENERLRDFGAQQREHIHDLASHQARLQAELTAARFRELEVSRSRPHTAPTAMPHPGYMQYRLGENPSTRSVGWRKGAGEEMSMFANAQPRILLPGDTMPFIGALRDRPSDNRRHLINQWRALRRRASPLTVTKPRSATSSIIDKSPTERPIIAKPGDLSPVETDHLSYAKDTTENQPEGLPRERFGTSGVENTAHRLREMSPKSVLREAKEKLKNYVKNHPVQAAMARDKSPNSVLREAKMRLRKLEIEAEAVEQSYSDFRRRQQQKFGADSTMDVSRSYSKYKDDQIEMDLQYKFNNDRSPNLKEDNRYSYQSKLNTMSGFRNTVTALVNAEASTSSLGDIENELKKSDNDKQRDYYLETPLIEFRKLYHSKRSASEKDEKVLDAKSCDSKIMVSQEGNLVFQSNIETPIELIREESPEARNKISPTNIEREMLKYNISKMYNLQIKDDEVKAGEESRDKMRSPTHIDKEILKDNISNLNNLQIKDDEVKAGEESLEARNKITSPTNIDKEMLKDNISKLNSLQNKEDEVKAAETTAVIATEETNNQLESRAEVKQPNNVNNDLITELLVEVESTIKTAELVVSDETEGKMSTQITVIASPKLYAIIDNDILTPSEKQVSVEDAAKLTTNETLNAIFEADASMAHSSVEMELNISKDINEHTDTEKGADDYPDDFSADVDNYLSRSNNESESPISIPKNSEEDNFWDTN